MPRCHARSPTRSRARRQPRNKLFTRTVELLHLARLSRSRMTLRRGPSGRHRSECYAETATPRQGFGPGIIRRRVTSAARHEPPGSHASRKPRPTKETSARGDGSVRWPAGAGTSGGGTAKCTNVLALTRSRRRNSARRRARAERLSNLSTSTHAARRLQPPVSRADADRQTKLAAHSAPQPERLEPWLVRAVSLSGGGAAASARPRARSTSSSRRSRRDDCSLALPVRRCRRSIGSDRNPWP